MNRPLLIGGLLLVAAVGRATGQEPWPSARRLEDQVRICRLPRVWQPESIVGQPPSAGPALDAPVTEATPQAAGAEEARPAWLAPLCAWDGHFEFGLNGSEGNSRTFNIHLGTDLKRKWAAHELAFDFDYHRNTSFARETAHRAFLDWRYQRLWEDQPWSWVVHGTVDYDEFKAFDLRVSADTGVGYELIRSERTTLAARLGGGFSHEIGGPDDAYVPELAAGADWEHQLTSRQKLAATLDYTPDVTDWGDFRLKTKVSWQVTVDDEANLSFKASVLDRYDSTPNGAEANDFDYMVTLLWGF